MHAVERDEEESFSGVELIPSFKASGTPGSSEEMFIGDTYSEEQGGEDENLVGGDIRDDIGWVPPHGLLWEVDQRVCYMIVISMAFSISTAVYLASFLYNVLGVMYLSLYVSLFTLIDTFLSTLLICRLLYFLKDGLQSKVAASRLFILLSGVVMCIASIVLVAKLRNTEILVEPDGRNVPGTASLKSMLAVFTILCVITAASRIVDALMSAVLIRRFENAQWYNSLLMQLTTCCRSKRKLVTPLCWKVCIVSCVTALAISFLFCGICMWSYLNNLVIDHSATAVYENCDPLIAEVCALPWPNDFFTESCNTSVTGLKLAVHSRVLPITRGGAHINPTSLNKLDGFSTSAPILFYMDGLSMHGFPNPLSIEDSVTASSASWLLDTSTGEPVPHFVQLDIDDPEIYLAVMQPAVPLAHGTRYVVGVVGARHVVSGNILPQTPGFSALVDASYDSETENARAKRFKAEVFPLLEKVGVSPSSLQLAFDFTTISADTQLGLIKNMRSHAMAEHSASNVKVLSSDEDANGFRTIWATITVPAYVDYYSRNGLLSPCGQRLVEGYSDLACELVEEGVLIRIPPSVLSGKVPLTTLVQFGHTLFWSRAEMLYTDFLDKMSNDNGWIMAATDWKGMSVGDLPTVARMLLSENVVNSFANMMNNLGQAFAVGDLLMSHLRESWMVYTSTQTRLVDGEKAPVSCFYGISEGGILGAAYTSFNSEFSRSVLTECGSPFALLLPRSKDWNPYLSILKLDLANAIDVQLLIVLWQSHWDAADAGGWLAAPREEGSATRVLIQVGLGDAEVSNLGSMVLARAFNAAAIPPLNQSIFGIPFAIVDSYHSDQYCSGNIVKLYNFSVTAWPKGRNTSIVAGVEDNHVHFRLRNDSNAQHDVVDFISTGCIESTQQ